VLAIFDLTQTSTFDHAKLWLERIDQVARENIVKLLVGTKSDLIHQRQVPFQTAQQFASSVGLQYVETSSNDGHQVQETFSQLACRIVLPHGSKVKNSRFIS